MLKIDTPCVIFAGGKSSRMKRDKSLMPFKGKPSLTFYQYDRLKDIFKDVYISTKKDKFDFDASLIIENSDIFAPIVAFEEIFKRFDTFFAISVDTPFVDEEIIKKIFNSYKKDVDAVVAKSSFIHPLIGIYNISILKNIKKEIKNGNFRLNHILKSSNTIFVEFDNEDKFLNINYPKDYEKAVLIT